MLHESAAFKSLFKSVTYLKGGVKSAFKQVTAHLAFRAGTTPTLAFCSRRRPLCVALPFA